MSGYVSIDLRRAVEDRSGACCEYCRLSQSDSAFRFHIEHIIAEKHGGKTILENLALSCPTCNAYKGSDISSIDWGFTNQVHPLFNPRTQIWLDHFTIKNVEIHPLTPVARVTVFLLRLNAPSRLEERIILKKLKRYPC
jgi:hypothetical protein